MIVAARWLRHTFSCQCGLVKAHKIDICYCVYDDNEDADDDDYNDDNHGNHDDADDHNGDNDDQS